MEHMAKILDAAYKVLEKPRDAETDEDIFIEALLILNGNLDKPITTYHLMVMVSRITQLEDKIKRIRELVGELRLEMEV